MVSIKGLLWAHTFYHGNGCCDRKCSLTKGLFINGIIVCRRLCYVWGIMRWGYRQVWKMVKCSGRKEPEGECQ